MERKHWEETKRIMTFSNKKITCHVPKREKDSTHGTTSKDFLQKALLQNITKGTDA